MTPFRLIMLMILATAFVRCSDDSEPVPSPDKSEVEEDWAPGFFDPTQDMTDWDRENGEIHRDLPTEGAGDPLAGALFFFPQSIWNECMDVPRGIYLGSRCVEQRGIAEALRDGLLSRLTECIRGVLPQSQHHLKPHIVHLGILGDPEHSPRSLHSERRAIDIRRIDLLDQEVIVRSFDYPKLSSRSFYTELRQCWGGSVAQDLNCPLVKNNTMLTGSIGWENRQHGRHLHLSAPVCANGRYSPDYSAR